MSYCLFCPVDHENGASNLPNHITLLVVMKKNVDIHFLKNIFQNKVTT